MHHGTEVGPAIFLSTTVALRNSLRVSLGRGFARSHALGPVVDWKHRDMAAREGMMTGLTDVTMRPTELRGVMQEDGRTVSLKRGYDLQDRR